MFRPKTTKNRLCEKPSLVLFLINPYILASITAWFDDAASVVLLHLPDSIEAAALGLGRDVGGG